MTRRVVLPLDFYPISYYCFETSFLACLPSHRQDGVFKRVIIIMSINKKNMKRQEPPIVIHRLYTVDLISSHGRSPFIGRRMYEGPLSTLELPLELLRL